MRFLEKVPQTESSPACKQRSVKTRNRKRLIMSKRPVDDIEDGNQAYLKRQKISNNPTFTPAPATDEIRSARKLRQILAFDQDTGRSKNGMLICVSGTTCNVN